MRPRTIGSGLVVMWLGCGAGSPHASSVREGVRRIEVGYVGECGEDRSSVYVRGATVRDGAVEIDLIHGGACLETRFTVCGQGPVARTEPGTWSVRVDGPPDPAETCLGTDERYLRLPLEALPHRVAEVEGITDDQIAFVLER